MMQNMTNFRTSINLAKKCLVLVLGRRAVLREKKTFAGQQAITRQLQVHHVRKNDVGSVERQWEIVNFPAKFNINFQINFV